MPKKPHFDHVSTKIGFPEEERKLLNKWEEKKIVDKYLRKNKTSERTFSFLDGPITANNPMGVHHAWGRTYKDLWQRYKNMQGFRQRFHNGFDGQGLWVEVEVEKELKFKGKKEIEKYGVDKFVEKCKERVEKYSKMQTQQSKRLGYFMDWENSYYTPSDENNYMIWHFLKVCHENGWLYKGSDSVPWCPRCETAISQHEILTEDYKEIVHKSIIFELPIIGRKDEYLLVWTTTPWTIPANIAVAVDVNLDYSLVKGSTGLKFWLAKEAVKKIFGTGKHEIIKTVKGKELVGLSYKGPFDELPKVKKVAEENPGTFHKVIPTDLRILPITTEEGTGLVHTAVSAGSEDYKLGQKLGLPMIPVIADNADYLEGLGFLSGKNAKDHPEVILDYLVEEDKKGHNWVFEIEDYKHRYPACWRCKSELVWKVTDEWYISMDKPSKSKVEGTLRERMIEVAKKIKWIPGFGLKRELDWLENMHDWLISKKNRYWGLALPIWECKKCNHFEVVGSKEELEQKAVEGWEEFKGKSPHKPQIDAVKVRCEKCGETTERIEPVGNPWLDAGIVSFSTIKKDNKGDPLYLTDKKAWEEWFPADFITESFPGQFKNWFYSLIAMSTVLENREPFNTVLGFATLLAEDGRPMHKSWGNAIEFNEGADRIGVDVMRWMYVRQNPTDNLLFGYKGADETRRRFHLKLWNSYNFFVTYASIDGWKPLATKNLKPSAENNLDKWILTRLNELVLDVTKNLDKYDAYSASALIEEFVDDFSNWYIRRSRERVGPTSLAEKKEDFYNTTYHILVTLSKLLAPFNPFLAEIIYQNLTKEESVHLASWPKVIGKTEKEVINKMKKIRKFSELAHSKRKLVSIPVRQPLSLLTIKTPEEKPGEEYLNLLKEELNIKSIKWEKSKEELVDLNTKITKELKDEAKARQLIRKIQDERRLKGMKLTQKIVVKNEWLPVNNKLTQIVMQKTLAKKLEKGKFEVKEIHD